MGCEKATLCQNVSDYQPFQHHNRSNHIIFQHTVFVGLNLNVVFKKSTFFGIFDYQLLASFLQILGTADEKIYNALIAYKKSLVDIVAKKNEELAKLGVKEYLKK